MIMIKNQRQHTRKSVLAFIGIAFCCTVILNYMFEKPLYLLGVDLIKKFQGHENVYYDYIFLFITMLLDPSIVIIGMITILLVSRNKKKALVMAIFVVFNTFLAALLKAYHIDPRPIWTHDDVRNIGLYCPVQYGNPSGHSWFSAIFSFGLILQYFGHGKHYRNFALCFLICIFVPMSRMYLGAHSLDQVLYGLSMGLLICIFFSIKLKYLIEQFLFKFKKSEHLKLMMVVFHILSLIPFIINMDNQLPQQWIDNIYRKCGKQMNQDRLNFLMLIVNAMLINIATGIGLAYHELVQTKHGRFYLSGNWRINREKYGKIYGYAFYIAIQVFLLICGFLIGGMISKIFMNKFIWYVCLSFGALSSGYCYTRFTVKFLIQYEVILEGRKIEIKNQ